VFYVYHIRKYRTNSWADLDSSTSAFAHGVGHRRTGRVDHGHEADEAQVIRGEVHLLHVKREVLHKLLVREAVMAETWSTNDEAQKVGVEIKDFKPFIWVY